MGPHPGVSSANPSHPSPPSPTGRTLLPLPHGPAVVCACSGIELQACAPTGQFTPPELRAQAPCAFRLTHAPCPCVTSGSSFLLSLFAVSIIDIFFPDVRNTGKHRKRLERPQNLLQASLCACLGLHPSILFYPKLCPESIFPSLLNNIIHSQRPCFPKFVDRVATIQPVLCQALEVPRTSRGEATLPLRGPPARGVEMDVLQQSQDQMEDCLGRCHGKNWCVVLRLLAWSAWSGMLPWEGPQ